MVSTFEDMPPILRPNEVMFHPMPSVKVGPTLPDGRRQTIQSAAPHWYAEIKYNLATADEVREWRAAIAKMEGGAREYIIPVYDRRQAPWPTGFDWMSSKPTVTVGGNVNRKQIIQVYPVAAPGNNPYGATIPAGTTRIWIDCHRSGRIRRGQYFSVRDKTSRQRLYMIINVERHNLSSEVGDVDSGYIDFIPPMRTDTPLRQLLDFDDPRATMTLAEPGSGQLTLRAWETYEPSIIARESFGGVF
jgi:hypothetical protein